MAIYVRPYPCYHANLFLRLKWMCLICCVPKQPAWKHKIYWRLGIFFPNTQARNVIQANRRHYRTSLYL